jgi:hypothetical protein
MFVTDVNMHVTDVNMHVTDVKIQKMDVTYMFEGATCALHVPDNAGLFAPSKTGTPLAPHCAHLR